MGRTLTFWYRPIYALVWWWCAVDFGFWRILKNIERRFWMVHFYYHNIYFSKEVTKLRNGSPPIKMTGNSSKDDRKYVKLQNSMVSSLIVPFPGWVTTAKINTSWKLGASFRHKVKYKEKGNCKINKTFRIYLKQYTKMPQIWFQMEWLCIFFTTTCMTSVYVFKC